MGSSVAVDLFFLLMLFFAPKNGFLLRVDERSQDSFLGYLLFLGKVLTFVHIQIFFFADLTFQFILKFNSFRC